MGDPGVPRGPAGDFLSPRRSALRSDWRRSADDSWALFRPGVAETHDDSAAVPERRGEHPDRVVAPTSVNRGRSIRIERADGPLAIRMSSWNSSIAGYRTSSTTRFIRWIS